MPQLRRSLLSLVVDVCFECGGGKWKLIVGVRNDFTANIDEDVVRTKISVIKIALEKGLIEFIIGILLGRRGKDRL